MKLTTKDKAIKLFRLINLGLLDSAEMLALIDSREVKLGDHLAWTLDQYATITSFKNDIDLVEYILQLQKSKLTPKEQKKFNSNVANLSVSHYLSILKFVKDGVSDIQNTISKIKQPEMSAEMLSAGYGKLDFGDLGIARTVGAFENIGTIAAYGLPMHIIIQSLAHIAQIKVCDKKHLELMELKNKTKNKAR